jgi:hypothetical protein
MNYKMNYKKKLNILLGIAAALSVVYIATILFDPERSGQRSDAYTWLEGRLRDSIDRIDMSATGSSGIEALRILRRNGIWVVHRDEQEYPARQGKVEDLLDELSRRDAYPLRSSSPSSHEKFGLSEAQASRITLRGGAGLPLLDLLIGGSDGGGRNVYLRKANSGEVRSGENRLSSFIESPVTSWFNLRIFPESETNSITAEDVQRLTVRPPAKAAAETPGEVPPGIVITRDQNTWRITSGELVLGPDDIEKSRVDSDISGILSTAGDDFVPPSLALSVTALDDGAVTLELGDGSVRALRFGRPDAESGQRQAALMGESPFVYSVASWASERIFREAEYFRK